MPNDVSRPKPIPEQFERSTVMLEVGSEHLANIASQVGLDLRCAEWAKRLESVQAHVASALAQLKRGGR